MSARPPFVLFLSREQIDAIAQVLEAALEDRSLDITTRAAIASAFPSFRRLAEPPEILETRHQASGSKGFR